MIEHSHPLLNEDPTVRIKSEVIEEIDKNQASLGPGEVRTIVPSENDTPERTLFRVTEKPLNGNTEADLFSLHTNTEGQWVLEGTGSEDAWVIPPDVEFSLGSDGVTMRARGDDPENARPLGLGRLPLVAQRLVAQAVGAQQQGSFSKVTFMAHPTEGGSSYLTVRNAGTESLAMEKHAENTTGVDESSAEEVPGAIEEKPSSTEGKTDEEESSAPEPEVTQAVDMTPILAEEREESIEEETEKGEAPEASIQSNEVVSESEAPVKPMTPKPQLSLAARLAGLETEPEPEVKEEPLESGKTKKLSIEGLDAGQSVEAITKHLSSQLDEISKQGKLRAEAYLQAVPLALRNGYTVAESNVLVTLEDLKKNLEENVESLDDMSSVTTDYIEAEQGVSPNAEIGSEAEQAQIALKSALEIMERMKKALKKMEEATVSALLAHKSIDNELRNVHGVFYQDVPGYKTIADTVREKTNELVDAINERTERGREARQALSELEELQKNLQTE